MSDFRTHRQSKELTDDEVESLTAAAKSAASMAYAPYSRFKVGAAIFSTNGLHLAGNIENASYGLSLCAERAALVKALSEKSPEIKALAVACVSAPLENGLESLLPCGACRQWLAEFAKPETEIFICGPTEELSPLLLLSELLPLPFKL